MQGTDPDADRVRIVRQNLWAYMQQLGCIWQWRCYYATHRLHMNTIEKRVELNASLARVWRALTDHREFGEWFRVKLDRPFVVGQVSTGHITYPGFEHVKWHATVKEMQPERLFSFSWHPYAIDPKVDY